MARTGMSALMIALSLVIQVGTGVGAEVKENLICDGSFNRLDLVIERAATHQNVVWAWVGFDFDFAISEDGGPDGRAAYYNKQEPGSANIHLDQYVAVEPNQVYEVRAWVRASSGLNPVFRVADKGFSTIVVFPTNATPEGSDVTFRFHSGDNERVRLQWFAGAKGAIRQGYPGESWLDNVTVMPVLSDESGTAVRLTPEAIAEPVSSHLFGANLLFFHETDPVWQNPAFTEAMGQMGIAVLRFPGGEVADNYLWDVRTLAQPGWFPAQYAVTDADMDTDDFAILTRRLGAEPIVVLNYKAHAAAGDTEAAMRSAEAWVRYVNVERGYGIRYWEFGNELYLPGSQRKAPLTGREYGELYARLRDRLRAIDPEVRLGAVMPTDVTTVVEGDESPWWDGFVAGCSGNADFVVLHTYGPSGDYLVSGFGLTRKVQAVQEYLSKRGMRAGIFITEHNAAIGWLTPLSIGHALAVGESLLDMAATGVRLATYWTTRYPDGRGLLDYQSLSPNPTGHVMRLLRAVAGYVPVGVEAERASSPSDAGLRVSGFVSSDGDQVILVVVNRWDKAAPLLVDLAPVLGTAAERVISLQRLRGANPANGLDAVTLTPETEVFTVAANEPIRYEAPPLSLTVLMLKGK